VDDILSIEHLPSFQRTVADSERRAIANCENKFTQEENGALSQRVVVIPSRRFGITYRSHLQWPRIFDSSSLKMEPIGCPETSVMNYHYTLRNSPEVRGSHLLRGGSFKFRILHKAVLKPMATKGASCLQEQRRLYINIQ